MSLVIPNKKWFKFSSFSCSSGKWLSGICCATLSINFQLNAPDGPAGSVTRFCQILPLWQYLKYVVQWYCLFIWCLAKFWIFLAIFKAICLFFFVANGHNLKKKPSHLVTLPSGKVSPEKKLYLSFSFHFLFQNFFNNHSLSLSLSLSCCSILQFRFELSLSTYLYVRIYIDLYIGLPM